MHSKETRVYSLVYSVTAPHRWVNIVVTCTDASRPFCVGDNVYFTKYLLKGNIPSLLADRKLHNQCLELPSSIYFSLLRKMNFPFWSPLFTDKYLIGGIQFCRIRIYEPLDLGTAQVSSTRRLFLVNILVGLLIYFNKSPGAYYIQFRITNLVCSKTCLFKTS